MTTAYGSSTLPSNYDGGLSSEWLNFNWLGDPAYQSPYAESAVITGSGAFAQNPDIYPDPTAGYVPAEAAVITGGGAAASPAGGYVGGATAGPVGNLTPVDGPVGNLTPVAESSPFLPDPVIDPMQPDFNWLGDPDPALDIPMTDAERRIKAQTQLYGTLNPESTFATEEPMGLGGYLANLVRAYDEVIRDIPYNARGDSLYNDIIEPPLKTARSGVESGTRGFGEAVALPYDLLGLDEQAANARQAGENLAPFTGSFVPVTPAELTLELIPGIGAVPGTASWLRKGGLNVGSGLAESGFKAAALEALPDAKLLRRSVTEVPQFSDEAAALRNVAGQTVTPPHLPAERFGLRTAGASDEVIPSPSSLPGPEAGISSPAAAPAQGADVVTSPVVKLTDAIKNATKATPEQRAMFAQQRAQRTARAAGALETGSGEQAFQSARGALGGEFARPTFQVPAITPDETHSLLETIRLHPDLRFYDKVNAERALQDVFSGRIPQPAQLNVLKRAFPEDGDKLINALLDKRSLGAKAWDEVVGALGLPQALSASFDISAPFRQGAVLGWSSPKEWVRSWSPMFKALKTEEGFQAAVKRVEDNPWFHRADGLGFKDVGGHVYDSGAFTEGLERAGGFAGLNQSYISRFAQNFPGIGTRRFERAFSGFLNEQGMSVYSKVAQNMWDAGVRDPQQFEALAKVINHGRGYGDFTVGQLAKGVNAFFSGRNFVSRFQVLADPFTQPGSILKPSARQQAAKNLGAMIAGDLTVLGFLGATGALTGMWSVETDPRSTDWGKVRIGNTRIDPWAGFSPMVRLAARVATGETKSSSGDFYPADAKNEVLRFLRNKAAPVPALVIDWLTGENAIGEEFDLSVERVASMFAPFIVQDVAESLKNSGVFAAAISGPAAAVGFGTTAYPESVSVLRDKASNKQFDMRYDELPPFAQAQINKSLLDQGENIDAKSRAQPYIAAGNGALKVAQSRLAQDWQFSGAERQFLDELGLREFRIMDYDNLNDAHDDFVEMARKQGASRVQAEGAWEDYSKRVLNLEKVTRQMREEAIREDPGIVDALDELYEEGADFAPPKWAREIVEELSAVQ